MSSVADNIEYLKRTKEFHQQSQDEIIIIPQKNWNSIPGLTYGDAQMKEMDNGVVYDYTTSNYDKYTHSIAVPSGTIRYKDEDCWTFTKVKLNEQGSVDFSLPENSHLITDIDATREIITRFPRAVETIPSSAMRRSPFRNAVIQAVGASMAKRYGVELDTDGLTSEKLSELNQETLYGANKSVTIDKSSITDEVTQDTGLTNEQEDVYMKKIIEDKLKQAFPTKEIDLSVGSRDRNLAYALRDVEEQVRG